MSQRLVRKLLCAGNLAAALLTLGACDSEGGGRASTGLVEEVPTDGGKQDSEVPGAQAEAWSTQPRVVVYTFDPKIEREGGRLLHEVLGWNDPHAMTFEYRDAVREATWGAVDYDIETWYRVDEFPRRTDGAQYDEDGYLGCVADTRTCLEDSPYKTDLALYSSIFGWCDLARDGVDEVWVFGAPWFGMPESQMAGDGAYWLNSTPLDTGCDTPLTIMAFSYHVPVSNMLHNLGHRIESHLAHSFSGWPSSKGASPWEEFSRGADAMVPACGNVHYPPNTRVEYGYTDAAEVTAGCEGWMDYPEHGDVEAEGVSCWTWGCDGDTQLNYLTWWIQHLPHREGTHEGFLTNWQRYIFDYRSHM